MMNISLLPVSPFFLHLNRSVSILKCVLSMVNIFTIFIYLAALGLSCGTWDL